MSSQRSWMDRLAERGARGLARRTSRRSLLARAGAALVGVAALPLLPVARAAGDDARVPAPDDSGLESAVGDPDELHLLAPLRHRRLPVRLLRRLAEHLPARERRCRR